MVTPPSPFALLDALADQADARLAPPPWLATEVQRRLLLLLNHVLMQEPEAMQRLQRQSGRLVQLSWRVHRLRIEVTPAGLLALATGDAPPDLAVLLPQSAPSQVLQALLAGQRPEVRIEGDVLLAAEVNWLVDHVRWDLEEDLSRLLGDAPARLLCETARRGAAALRQFVQRAAPPAGGAAS